MFQTVLRDSRIKVAKIHTKTLAAHIELLFKNIDLYINIQLYYPYIHFYGRKSPKI